MATIARFDPDSLRCVPLFAQLTSVDLRRLAGLVCRVRLAAGATLAGDGPEDHALIIVVDGIAEVDRPGDGRAPGQVAEIGPGEHVGEELLLHEPGHAATVRAVTDVVIDQIAAHDFRALLQASPELTLPMLAVLGERLARESGSSHATERVA